MKKKAALHLVMLLLTGISSTEVMAGATISDRRYWPNEAIASPSRSVEIAPPYTYPIPLPEPGQPRIRPRRKAQKSRQVRGPVAKALPTFSGLVRLLAVLLAVAGLTLYIVMWSDE